MASAAQSPNCVCDNLSHSPIAGNVSSAIEFSTNTVPSETDISSSVAPVIGPTAAIALPPQMAVPVEIRNAGRARTDSNQPSRVPSSSANVMLMAVYTKPLLPALITSCRFIPKPRPTTAACSSNLEACRDGAGYGCVAIDPKSRPASRASGGEAQGVRQKIIPQKKSSFELFGLIERNFRDSNLTVRAGTS
jgi:hypothetical protein